jgi:hypothetical protein
MPLVNFSDAKWTSKGQAMRRAAHFRFGRNDVNIANIAQRIFERLNAFGVDAVVIGHQYPIFSRTHFFENNLKIKDTPDDEWFVKNAVRPGASLV